MGLHPFRLLPASCLVALAIGCGGNVVVDGASSRGTSGAGASSGSHGTSSMGNGASGVGAGGATTGSANGGSTSGIGGAGAGDATSGSSNGGSGAISSSSASTSSSSSTGAGGGPTGALWDILGLPATLQPPGVFAPLMAVDSSGNAFFAAYYSGGPVTFSSSVACTSPTNVLVAKVSPAGQLLWLNCISRLSSNDPMQWLSATGLAVSETGQVSLIGFFNGQIGYDSTTFTSTSPAAADGYILALDASSGAVGWSRQFALADQGLESWGLASDAAGNLYFGGYLDEPLDLGSTSLVPQTNSLFVAKLDASGDGVWITEVAHDISAPAQPAIAVTPDGSRCALQGTYRATVDFGSEQASPTNSPLLVQLDTATGAIAWGIFPAAAHDVGGFGPLAFDGLGNLVIGGVSVGLDLGAGPIAPDAAFLAKLDPTGAVVWQKPLSGMPQPGQQYFQLDTYSVAADAAGDVLFLGYTDAPLISLGTATFACPATGNFIGCFFVVHVDPSGDATFGDFIFGSKLAGGMVAFGAGHPLIGGAFSRWVDFGAGPVPSPPTGDAVFLAELP